MLDKVVKLYESGKKSKRIRADSLIRTTANNYDLQNLLNILQDQQSSIHKKMAAALAIGYHTKSGSNELEMLYNALENAIGESTVYAYRVLSSIRKLLSKNIQSDNMNKYNTLVEHYKSSKIQTLRTVANDIYFFMNKSLPQTHELEGLSKDMVKIKILFLGANPSGSRLKLDEEVKKIQTNLKLAKERDNLELKQEWAVTTDTLMQTILDESPNIVHFSGHGKQEGIILQDEIGNPKTIAIGALANLFKLFKDSVTCVVLNSCYSEVQAEAIKVHIPYVIGMKSGMPDKAAISFSSGFYKAIGAGKNIPFAFELGKAAILLDGIPGKDIPILLL